MSALATGKQGSTAAWWRREKAYRELERRISLLTKAQTSGAHPGILLELRESVQAASRALSLLGRV